MLRSIDVRQLLEAGKWIALELTWSSTFVLYQCTNEKGKIFMYEKTGDYTMFTCL